MTLSVTRPRPTGIPPQSKLYCAKLRSKVARKASSVFIRFELSPTTFMFRLQWCREYIADSALKVY
jgi:hypothetical protein